MSELANSSGDGKRSHTPTAANEQWQVGDPVPDEGGEHGEMAEMERAAFDKWDYDNALVPDE